VRLRLLVFLALLLVPGLATSKRERTITWSEWESGKSDVRHGEFTVADPACAYRTMADPKRMNGVLPHLEGVTVHKDDGTNQDVTLEERFWPVGLVTSRYDRQVDGAARLTWQLTKGRQAKHDGYWQVHDDGRVVFENEIQAKSILHRALLRSIQVRAMEGVATSIQEHCGS